jgi:hypothetical protein
MIAFTTKLPARFCFFPINTGTVPSSNSIDSGLAFTARF